MDMDLGTIVIWLAAFVVVAAVSFLVSVLSFKEKTFEQALAEQRETDGSASKSDKDKSSKDKKGKRWVKKPKDKSGDGASSSPEGKLHVEFEPAAEIITLPPTPAPTEEKPVAPGQEKHKKEKVKPILRNRGENSPLAADKLGFDPDVDSANHFTEHPPKDDVELKTKDEHHKIVNGSTKPNAPLDNGEPEVVKTTVTNLGAENSSPSTPKKDKKKKQKPKPAREGAVDGDELYDRERLLANLHKAVLSNSDIQMLIEALLHKQQENVSDAGWIEKGKWDPVSALKKQLADVEQQLQESREAAQAFQAKLKTMGADLTAERNRTEQARKQGEEAATRLQNELQTLRQQHTMEVQALSNKLHAVQNAPAPISEEQMRAVQMLQEEKASLEAHFATSKKIQQDMSIRIQQLEEHIRIQDQQRRDEELQHQSHLNRLAAQLQEYEQSKVNLMVEVSQGREAQKVIQTLQHENSSLQEALRNAEAVANHRTREAATKIEELERSRQTLESRLSSLEADLTAEKQKSAAAEQLQRRVQQLEGEHESLNTELRTLREKPSVEPVENQLKEKEQEVQNLKTRLQQLEGETKSVNAELKTLRERPSAEPVEKQLKEKEQELQTLKTRLQELEGEKESMSGELKTLREKPSVEPIEHQLKEKEQELQGLKIRLQEAEANSAKAESALQAATAQVEQSQRLGAELEEQKDANNKLREKNWKVVEAVSKAEKTVEDLKRQLQEQKSAAETSATEQKRQLQQIVKRLLPDCDLPIPTQNGSVLEAVENVLNRVVALRANKKEEQPKEDVSDLSNQVRHYKNVLAQTEGLLRQLEIRVKEEETKWKNLLAEKVAALEAAERERDFFCKQSSQTSTQQNALVGERNVIESLQQQVAAMKGRVSDS